jgi:hypothetical protein
MRKGSPERARCAEGGPAARRIMVACIDSIQRRTPGWDPTISPEAWSRALEKIQQRRPRLGRWW